MVEPSQQASLDSLGSRYIHAFTWTFLLLVALLVKRGFLETFSASGNGHPWLNPSTVINPVELIGLTAVFLAILSVIVRYLIFTPWPIYASWGTARLEFGNVAMRDVLIAGSYFLLLFAASYAAVRSLVRPGMLFFALLLLPLIDGLLFLILLLELLVTLARWLAGKFGLEKKIEKALANGPLTKEGLERLRPKPRLKKYFKQFTGSYWLADLVDIFFLLLALRWVGVRAESTATLVIIEAVERNRHAYLTALCHLDQCGPQLTYSIGVCMVVATLVNVIYLRPQLKTALDVLFNK